MTDHRIDNTLRPLTLARDEVTKTFSMLTLNRATGALETVTIDEDTLTRLVLNLTTPNYVPAKPFPPLTPYFAGVLWAKAGRRMINEGNEAFNLGFQYGRTA